MPPRIRSVLDDADFTVQVGVIPSRARLSGTELGPGIIYYPVDVLTHHLRATVQTPPPPSATGLTVLWSAGAETEIFNNYYSSCQFIRVALKPSPQLSAELPQDFLGLASAALLQDDWAEPFKASVRDDLDAIRAFIEPLASGEDPDPESRERALLAKQDLDLKLFWSAGEYRRHGVFTLAYRTAALSAATPATGLINVTVNTKDQTNAAVAGCVVWYVTQINHSRPGSYNSFSQLSTPTSEHLSVGNYDMWTQKGGAAGVRRPINIVSVSATQFVDLFAP